MIELLKDWDSQLFIFLNGIHSPFWDTVMWWVSGTKSWIPLYIILVAYIIYNQRKRSLLTLLFIAILVVLADQISVHFFKDVFQRLRPCHQPELVDIVHLVKNKCGGKYGFVSSHATNTFAIASFLSLLFKNKYFSGFIIFWAAFVSYSRIYLGVHFPFDVLCGAILGTIIGILVFIAYKNTLLKIDKRVI
ncbi:MAG: hypothetical protein A2X13_08910 [Bacteroidetes bacterium GWC2_33_15]|nr:MAG: hypothetical protein A2X10_14805 [Bacteroidetes bacterium GWA2_33_15]OFX51371.1 MAG: hypothetical protein A2X13_08910 [Bacteroidetes bacterium GWC2_33_15]OFX63155.1 MAG: hypothetical protein A2X15_14140 [Bacteroidetes bacterium GWB2_32_14]OFX70747.1 MAG: hypothetical protein A2X14_11285 [Bacteroidetes bacterium GWD2_33_33]HAN18454.1 phosphatase PAP2 family protein [Bacteroidales bacterium]